MLSSIANVVQRKKRILSWCQEPFLMWKMRELLVERYATHSFEEIDLDTSDGLSRWLSLFSSGLFAADCLVIAKLPLEESKINLMSSCWSKISEDSCVVLYHEDEATVQLARVILDFGKTSVLKLSKIRHRRALVRELFAAHKKKINDDAAAILLSMFGRDLKRLDQEIQTLSSGLKAPYLTETDIRYVYGEEVSGDDRFVIALLRMTPTKLKRYIHSLGTFSFRQRQRIVPSVYQFLEQMLILQLSSGNVQDDFKLIQNKNFSVSDFTLRVMESKVGQYPVPLLCDLMRECVFDA